MGKIARNEKGGCRCQAQISPHNWSRSPNSTAPMATIPQEKLSLQITYNFSADLWHGETCCETLWRLVQGSRSLQAMGDRLRPLLNKDHHGTAGGLHPTLGSQDGKIGTRREWKTFSQFVECSRISLAACCDCHASDGGSRERPHRGPTCKRKIFSRFCSSRFSRLLLYCLNLSLAQKDSIARVVQLLPRALPSVPDLPRASATCWAVCPSRVRSQVMSPTPLSRSAARSLHL